MFIRYFVLNVLGKSFIGEWLIGKERSSGSMCGGGISNFYLEAIIKPELLGD